jgi:hypothetical protein
MTTLTKKRAFRWYVANYTDADHVFVRTDRHLPKWYASRSAKK